MKSKLQNYEKIFAQFTGEIRGIFGDDMISVILFGSAVTNDFIPGRSDLNFLVGLTSNGLKKIKVVQKYLRRWQRKNISLPLFLTKEYINASLDSFPIEFLNMQTAYRVISGEDLLKELEISMEDLRLQCERELKGNLLKLRQGFIETASKKRDLKLIISRSMVAFISIFKALLYLREKEIPQKRKDVLFKTCSEFGINEDLFVRLLSVKNREIKLNREQMERIMNLYIAEIQKISESIDKMEVSKR